MPGRPNTGTLANTACYFCDHARVAHGGGELRCKVGSCGCFGFAPGMKEALVRISSPDSTIKEIRDTLRAIAAKGVIQDEVQPLLSEYAYDDLTSDVLRCILEHVTWSR